MKSTLIANSDDPLAAPRPLLEVRNISCNYGLERAVFDLSLTVHRGEQVCLLGPSGCGKTTVLRAIAGFHPLLTGEICINDQQVSAVGAMVPPEVRRVGMVFQDRYSGHARTETKVLKRPWFDRDNPTQLEPVYCYKTLVELECFDKARAGDERPAVWTYKPVQK